MQSFASVEGKDWTDNDLSLERLFADLGGAR